MWINKDLFSKLNIIRALLLVASVVAIIFSIPEKGAESQWYEVGHPWAYEAVYSPERIAVPLDSARIKQIDDSIMSEFVPFYKFDENMAGKMLQMLNARMVADKGTSLRNKNKLRTLLVTLYKKGVVDGDTYHQIQVGNVDRVNMLYGNEARQQTTSQLRSIKEVYESLDSVSVADGVGPAFQSYQVSQFLEPNVTCDDDKNANTLYDMQSRAHVTTDWVESGELIVDRGQKITPRIFSLLKARENVMKKRSLETERETLVGKGAMVVLVVLIMCTLYCFLGFFRKRTFASVRDMTFIVSIITAISVMMAAMCTFFAGYVYLFPFAMGAIVVSTFLDSRTAFFVHISTMMICMLIVPYPTEFMLMQFSAGVIATIGIKEFSRRSQLVQCAVYVFVAYTLIYVCMTMHHSGTLISVVNGRRVIGMIFGNAILLSFSYVLIFLIEKLFGYTSSVTLVELSDINSPMLRELSDNCPGTFNHSLQVANLAAEAAHEIGANVQLVRAGALYHDIGKIRNPAFFTENQQSVNPHNTLSPYDSAKIVVSHVTDGLELADKAKLPTVIKDFIKQHHGKGVARYFYAQACNANPDAPVDATPFSYPGPNPQSKETAILMMADSCEAASRSLADHSEAAIASLVNKIVNTQISEGLLREAPISFRDVETIKQTFIKRLCSIYHMRVKYPEMVKHSEPGEEPVVDEAASE